MLMILWKWKIMTQVAVKNPCLDVVLIPHYHHMDLTVKDVV